MLELLLTDNQISALGRISLYVILGFGLYEIVKYFYLKNVRILVWVCDFILIPYWFITIMFIKTNQENFMMLFVLLRMKAINKIANKIVMYIVYLRLFFANYSSQEIENELTNISNKINKKSEN